MYLYHLSQLDARGYDTYSDCVVAEVSEQEAKRWLPRNKKRPTDELVPDDGFRQYRSWAWHADLVACKLIGTATEGTLPGVICASYHAG
jgi:hypothetical protein